MRRSIAEFQGPYRFLSNFWPVQILMDGVHYPSIENAFQAAKALDPQQRRPFEQCSPAEAKKLGRRVTLRKDWEQIKLQVMAELLAVKFAPGSRLAQQLLGTGEQLLQEGNRWGDRYWGVDLQSGQGLNHLGRLLMERRGTLRN